MKIERFYIDANMASKKLYDLLTAYCHIVNTIRYSNAKIVVTPTMLGEQSIKQVWLADNLHDFSTLPINQTKTYHPDCVDFEEPNAEDFRIMREYLNAVHDSEGYKNASDQEVFREVYEYGLKKEEDRTVVGALPSSKDAGDRSIKLSVKNFLKDMDSKKMRHLTSVVVMSKDSEFISQLFGAVGGKSTGLFLWGNENNLYSYIQENINQALSQQKSVDPVISLAASALLDNCKLQSGIGWTTNYKKNNGNSHHDKNGVSNSPIR